MWQPRKKWMGQHAPTLAAGLFVGRLLSEQVPILTAQSLIGVIIVTAVSITLIGLLMRRVAFRQSWPLLLLLFYIIYPEPDPKTALFTFLTVIIIFGLLRPNRMPPAILPLLLAFFFSALYLFTLAPDILPADNGEFQLVAAQLGVAHPPGFSLYTLLAHLFTRLPLPVTAAYKVNLFSSVTSVLTLLLVYLTVQRLTYHKGAAVTTVIALGTATTFWSQATTANIRSLTGLFAAAMIYTLVRYRDNAQDKGAGEQGEKSEPSPPPPRSSAPLPQKEHWLILFGLAVGFGITHHASLVFMSLLFFLYLLAVDPSLLKEPKRWLRPILAGLVGLLPLIYFPLRAGTGVRGASAGLATLSGFLNHVLALGFRGDLFHFIEPALLWQRFQVMGNVLTFQFSPWLLAGMVLGLALLLRQDRILALLLGGSFVFHTFITATYRAPQTVEYMLPAYVPAVIGLGYAVGQIDRLIGRSTAGTAVSALFGAGMMVAAVYQGWQHYPSFAFLHQDSPTRDYAQYILQEAPEYAVVLADWHWATPLWYLQEVEKRRPDISVNFVFPEGEPYAETWARRIREGMGDGRSVIATHFDENAFASLPTPEPLGDAFLFHQQPHTTLPNNFTPLNLTLNNEIHLLGYQLDNAAIEIGQETTLTIAWKPAASSLQSSDTGQENSSVSLFAHLIGADGRLYAQDDRQVEPQPDGLTLTQFRLTPRLGSAPGDYSIFIGNAEAGEERLPIGILTVLPMDFPPATQNPVYRNVPSGRPLLRLVGYDWDNTLPDRPRLYLHWQTEQGYQTEVRDDINPDGFTLPAYFGPWGIIRNNQQLTIHHQQFYLPLGQGIVWTGQPLDQQPITSEQTLSLPQTFLSSQPMLTDQVISVRLIGLEEDGFHWEWWDLADSIPAMGAIPTLKWIAGSIVRSPFTLTIDPSAKSGQNLTAVVRVYDAFTNQPLPILDERITNELQLPWLPLGQSQFNP